MTQIQSYYKLQLKIDEQNISRKKGGKREKKDRKKNGKR
jgi:hypothetical protein